MCKIILLGLLNFLTFFCLAQQKKRVNPNLGKAELLNCSDIINKLKNNFTEVNINNDSVIYLFKNGNADSFFKENRICINEISLDSISTIFHFKSKNSSLYNNTFAFLIFVKELISGKLKLFEFDYRYDTKKLFVLENFEKFQNVNSDDLRTNPDPSRIKKYKKKKKRKRLK